MTGRLDPTAYSSLWQLRGDAWGRLEDASERLAAAGSQGNRIEALVEEMGALYELLEPIEHYWGFPGTRRFERARRMFAAGEYERFARMIAGLGRELATESYRRMPQSPGENTDEDIQLREVPTDAPVAPARPYFEVLVVERMGLQHEDQLGEELRRLRRPDDEFVYDVVVVPSYEDAVIAVQSNFNIQACVIRRRFSHQSLHDLSKLGRFVEDGAGEDLMKRSPDERQRLLGRRLRELRPELDLYLMSQISVESIAAEVGSDFRRVFHPREGLLELHLSILRGVGQRYRAPFFSALRDYSQRPTGVFHALPISRGKSIVNSHWIRDMIDFYGLDVFLAETSATCGGLDSLLEPTGPLREAQEQAAETFGSRQTFFVTNGTSTGNKVVVQALVRPGDIVLVDRNCHQSHHYGLVQAGAHVTYLEAYGLNDYSMYGAVPLREIKRALLALRRDGKLDRVKLLMLTNCTFDGIIYDVERVMEECLAIKPDLGFLWDEAWFAFARFHPVYRSRTAMACAANLLARLRDPEYRARHAAYAEELARSKPDDDQLLDLRLLPDPECARVRVYATQSTHKTLSSLRQGSMIHVFDQDFSQRVEESFYEAYMAHTSTSPNYQILASLDLGRRQAALEGFELVQKQVDHAMSMRDAINNHPLLSHYMRCLTTSDLIPDAFRTTGIERPVRSGRSKMIEAWKGDEFVLDPCRVTLFIGGTGIDGDTFKRLHLMDRYGVQINKTSRNTVLFMTHIGTTRSAVAYLIEVLVEIAREIEDRVADMSPRELTAQRLLVDNLTKKAPPLPDFSSFHDWFREKGSQTPEGDMRRAFYLAYDDSLCEYFLHDELFDKVSSGQSVVSASFVTPYPPGFPVLVPGQIISPDVLSFIGGLDVKEIHGYKPHLGYRVFIEKALEPPQLQVLTPTLIAAGGNEDRINEPTATGPQIPPT